MHINAVTLLRWFFFLFKRRPVSWNRQWTILIKVIAAAKRKPSDAKRVLTMAEKNRAKLEGMDAQPKPVTDNLDFNAVQQVTHN